MSSSFNDDSGYLSFHSPCRLSPSNPLDSPQSPVNRLVSTIDYENYITTRKFADIFSQLDHRNAFHIIDSIAGNVSDRDFLACRLVCKKWYSILKDVRRRKQTKNVKRNLFHETTKLTSTPMQSLTNRMPMKSPIPMNIETEEESVHLTASMMTFRYGYLKYLHGPTIPKRCPICSFVSIVDVNDQHGICTNPLCGNSFCQCCSGPYHPSSPCKTSIGPIRSPWRKRASISPIFSNKTRNNLRRLLI